MRAGLGIGVDRHRAGPDLFGTGAGMIDGGSAVHAGRLGGIVVERIAGDDLHAIVAPVYRRMVVGRFFMVVMMIVIVVMIAHVRPPWLNCERRQACTKGAGMPDAAWRKHPLTGIMSAATS